MSKNFALVLIFFSAIIACIGLACVTVPGKETAGILILLGAIIIGLTALFTKKKSIIDEYENLTEDDFTAPEGQFRIMKEDVSDGELEIVADIRRYNFALTFLKALIEENDEDMFTLCDDQGNAIEPQ